MNTPTPDQARRLANALREQTGARRLLESGDATDETRAAGAYIDATEHVFEIACEIKEQT
jgi:hypothetical protein